jgi:membrane protein YqaA with SNARE-associated domain
VTTWQLALVGLAALAFGLGSAVIPVLNAEVYAVATAAGGPAVAVVSVLGVAIGQTAGKVAMLLAVRRGMESSWLSRWRTKRAGKNPPKEPHEPGAVRRILAGWSATLLRQMDRRVVGGLVVLLSSVVGLPPLAAVTVLAGMRSLPLWVFTVAVGIGRVARFAALAWPVVRLAH